MFVLAPLRFQIEHLPADHAPKPGGARQHQREIGAHGGIGMGRRVRDHVEGVGEQRVAGENGAGFIKGLVQGRTSPAQIVVVHGRQIVMDQRITMNHLKRASRAKNSFVLRPNNRAVSTSRKGRSRLPPPSEP